MYQPILTLIEQVDPSDTQALDDIDARCRDYFGHSSGLPYTRSRDALKTVLPNWRLEVVYYNDTNDRLQIRYHRAPYNYTNPHVMSPLLPTWELAELHAIIQALAFDRDLYGERDAWRMRFADRGIFWSVE